MRGDVPPSFRGPTLGVLIADRNADPARRGVAELEIGKGRSSSKDQEEKERHRRPESPGRARVESTGEVSRVPCQVESEHHPSKGLESRLMNSKDSTELVEVV